MEYQHNSPPSAVLAQGSWTNFDCNDLMIASPPDPDYSMGFADMPDPKTAFDRANEPSPWDPSQAYFPFPPPAPQDKHFDWQYNSREPLKASSMPIPYNSSSWCYRDPITHSDGGMHLSQNAFKTFTEVDGELSQAHSADVAKSSQNYLPFMILPTTSNASSTDPTEYEMPTSLRAFDEASDSADARAGVPLDLMEGMIDTTLKTAHLHPCANVEDGNRGLGEDECYGLQHIDALAFSGEHLSEPDISALHYPYNSIHESMSGISNNFLGAQNSSSGFDSNRYEPGVAGSYPTTARHSRPQAVFPIHPSQDLPDHLNLSKHADNLSRRRADSSPQMPLRRAPPVHFGVNRHRRRRSTTSLAKADSNRLAAISEVKEAALLAEEAVHEEEGSNTQPHQRTVSKGARPRRTKPLPDHTREAAAHRRKKRDTCMPCKHHRITCDGKMPCNKCTGSRNGRACVPADWSGYVLTAACDSLFHRTLWQRTHTGELLTITQIPPSFDNIALLQILLRLRSSHNIYVTHASMSSYEIDLEMCITLLFQIKQPTFNLQDLFEKEKLGASPPEWIKALRGFDQDMTEAERLIDWGSIPSLATYRLIPLRKATSPSSVNIYDHLDILRSAMALNRIILRSIEILGHRSLQKQCKMILQTSAKAPGPEIVALVQALGKIACSLRLRIALTKAYEQPSVENAETLTDPMDRLKNVTRIIYFWFLIGLKKRQKDVDMDFHGETNHLSINGRHVSDPFPPRESDESNSSFETWLSHGQAVLLDAGLSEHPSNSYHTLHRSFDRDQSFSSWGQVSFQS